MHNAVPKAYNLQNNNKGIQLKKTIVLKSELYTDNQSQTACE